VSRRRPDVEVTRFHPAGCTCGESHCIALQIKLDVTAVFDGPAPARCDGYEAEALEAHRVRMVGLLRGEDDADVALARKAGG